MAEKKEFSYDVAMTELEQILNQIESGECSMDKLVEKIQQASTLIKTCKSHLTSLEQEIDKSLEEF